MPATDKKMSVIDAAAKLLADAGEPLNCKTMIEQIAANGYWTSPRFKKTDRGNFAING